MTVELGKTLLVVLLPNAESMPYHIYTKDRLSVLAGYQRRNGSEGDCCRGQHDDGGAEDTTQNARKGTTVL